MKAAIYTRVSTEGQVDGTSLADQLALCRAYVDSRGWQLVETYSDQGLSGASAARPAWRAMLADAQAGRFDAVVVNDLSRFARNAALALTEIDRLAEIGVNLVSRKEGFDPSTPSGKLMLGVMASFNEFDRANITARGAQGQRAKARSGAWPGGAPMYGWRLEGSGHSARPVPDEREREVLALIYQLIAVEHASGYQAAATLNAKGITTRLGKRWRPGNLRKLVGSPTLSTGVAVWGKTHRKPGPDTTRLDAKGQPKYGEPISYTLPDPPWTPEQQARVLQVLELTSDPSATPGGAVHLLSGMIATGCGRTYTGKFLASRNIHEYRCSGRASGIPAQDRCDCPRINARYLDDRVWDTVAGVLGDPERLVALAAEWLAIDDLGQTSNTQALQGDLDRLRRQIKRATDLLVDAEDEASETAARQVLAERRAELAVLEARAEQAADADQARARLRDLGELARQAGGRLDQLDKAQRRQVLMLLNVQVELVDPVVRARPGAVRIRAMLDEGSFELGIPAGSGPAPATR